MKNLLFLFAMLLCTSLYGQRIHPESYYQDEFAKIIGGETELVLPDRTRVDILTDKYAIEVDFANKWAEGIGQSLYYALSTGKRPGVLLITEKWSRDEKYLSRLMQVAARNDIKVWIIDSELKWSEVSSLISYEVKN